MASVNIYDILNIAYGPKGLPFPKKPNTNEGNPIATGFQPVTTVSNKRSNKGAALFGQNNLGMPVFLPAKLNNEDLPNPLITITGEKSIIETDVIDVGTVFEKVFTRPYDITIICTLINAEGTWPESEIERFAALYREKTLYTLSCPLTDIFLTQQTDNFLLTKINVLDMGSCENAQVIQLDGRSNVDFELVIN